MIRRALALALAAVTLLLGAPVAANAGTADVDHWQLEFLRAAEAHAISQGEGVTVAVIDSGVDATHPDLAGSVVPGFNPDGVGAADGTSDTNGHGTAMAGLIAGHGTMIGIAPKAKIMPIRSSNTTNLARSIDLAVEHGAQVINISQGVPTDSPQVRRAVDAGLAAGVVIVAGAGNVPTVRSVGYPAAYEGVIAAAAVTRTGEHAAVSVRGDQLVLAAPGEEITSTGPGGTYVTSEGTSDASALISGTAALVKAKFPTLPGREIYHRLTATADDKGTPGRDPDYGFGIVNPVQALTADVPPLPVSPGPDPSPDADPGSPQARPGDDDNSGIGSGLIIGLVALGLLLVAGLVTVVAITAARRTSR